MFNEACDERDRQINAWNGAFRDIHHDLVPAPRQVNHLSPIPMF